MYVCLVKAAETVGRVHHCSVCWDKGITDRQTDRQTHKTTAITLAVHVRRVNYSTSLLAVYSYNKINIFYSGVY